MRALCCGDVHFGHGDSYGRVPGERLAEQEAVWGQIIALAGDREADAILVAGDVFEGPLPTPEHYAAFARPLRDATCPVIAISGNGRHDSAMRDTNALEVIGDLLVLHTRPAVTEVAGVSIACLPWAPVSRLVAAHADRGRDDLHSFAAELLLETARWLRAQTDGPMILLTHYAISGASLPNGMTSDQLREVVLPLSELERLGFDAIVAGHLHRPQLLATDPADPMIPILYVGSPLPLDFGEGGYEHGCWIVDLDPLFGASVPEFVPIASRRFVTAEFDFTREAIADGTAFEDELYGAAHLAAFKADTGLAGAFVKIRYRATSEQAAAINDAALRQDLLDAGAHKVWIEPTIERDARARVEGMDESMDDRQALDMWLDAQDAPDRSREALRPLHEGYLAEVAA